MAQCCIRELPKLGDTISVCQNECLQINLLIVCQFIILRVWPWPLSSFLVREIFAAYYILHVIISANKVRLRDSVMAATWVLLDCQDRSVRVKVSVNFSTPRADQHEKPNICIEWAMYEANVVVHLSLNLQLLSFPIPTQRCSISLIRQLTLGLCSISCRCGSSSPYS